MNTITKRVDVSTVALFASALALSNPTLAAEQDTPTASDTITLSAGPAGSADPTTRTDNAPQAPNLNAPGEAASGFENQTPNPDDPQRPGMAATKPMAVDSNQLVSSYQQLKTGGALRGGAIIGKKIVGANGEDIGKVAEIAVSPDGGISNVVVSVGGFMGVGDRLVVLPWEALEISPSNDTIKAYVTKSEIAQAPLFDEISDSGMQLELEEPK